MNFEHLISILGADIEGKVISVSPELVDDIETRAWDELGLWFVTETVTGKAYSRRIYYRPSRGVSESEEGTLSSVHCPLSYFKLVPCVTNTRWRAKVVQALT